MAFTGMDTAVVREIGNRLKSQADDVGVIIASVDRLIQDSAAVWDGQDARQFDNWWRAQHRPALHQAQLGISGLGQSALNNVSEQEQASGAGSSGSGAASVSASGSAEAAPHAGASTGAPAAHTHSVPGAGAAHPAVTEFVKRYNGKGLDFDGVYGNQCVDLFEYYNRDIVGAPPIHMAVTGGARDLFEAQPGATPQYYDRIPYASGMVPQPGDVAVWTGTTENQYGHVAVVTGASSGGFNVIQQNGLHPTAPAYTGTFSYNSLGGSLLGFLRPKKFA